MGVWVTDITVTTACLRSTQPRASIHHSSACRALLLSNHWPQTPYHLPSHSIKCNHFWGQSQSCSGAALNCVSSWTCFFGGWRGRMETARASTTSTQLRNPLVLPGLAHGHHQGTDGHKSCGSERQLSVVGLEGQAPSPHRPATVSLARGQISLHRR